MLKIITSLTAALIGLLANAQTTETRNLSQFNKIEIIDRVEVIYTQGRTYSVTVQAGDAPGLASLVTELKNQTLVISCNENHRETIRVYITSPEIESIKGGHNSKIVIEDRINTPHFALSLASGATFNGNVTAKEATLKGKSGSVFNIRLEADSVAASFQNDTKVNLSGHAAKSVIRTTGNVLCNARNFITSDTEVSAMGTANVVVCAQNKISVTVAERATVKYLGMPNQSEVNVEAVSFVDHSNAAIASK